jgi:hypothetical protein
MLGEQLPAKNWVLRLRFRIDKPLDVSDAEIVVTIDERQGTLSAREAGPLSDAEWIILKFCNFPNQDDAQSFGNRLSEAMLIGAVKGKRGLDLGKNRPSLQYSREVKDAVKAKTGVIVMDDVHGMLIYEKTGSESFPYGSARVEVRQPAEPIITAINAEMKRTPRNNTSLLTACELIALSLMSSDALARGAMCMSAIELLAATPWTENQHSLLKELRAYAAGHSGIPPKEADEVAHAMQNVFKSVRQGLRRLIRDELKMGKEIWDELDELYTLRSKIFHGKTGFDPDSNQEFGDRAWKMASNIVTVIAAKLSKSHQTE